MCDRSARFGLSVCRCGYAVWMPLPAAAIDLHCHSRASDGQLSPTELLDLAAAQGVQRLALTDHDTVAGLAEAGAAAARHGIELIPAVELSVTWERRTLHVVGLQIDTQAPALTAGLAKLQDARQERAQAMAERIEKAGVADAWSRLQAITPGAQPTRTHMARLLVESGLVKDMKQAFKRYLGAGKPAYVRAEWASLREAINWIHAAGGLAVLAHPMRYPMTANWRERALRAFKEAGGDAMEVCSGACLRQEVEQATRLAQKFELLASVGSDFHGPEQHWLQLGRLAPLPPALTPVWSQLRGAI